jgi:hypothetical protein
MGGKFLLKKPAGYGRHLFLWEENSSIENMLAVADICFYGRKISLYKICWLWQTSVSIGGKFLLKHLLAVADICFMRGKFIH